MLVLPGREEVAHQGVVVVSGVGRHRSRQARRRYAADQTRVNDIRREPSSDDVEQRLVDVARDPDERRAGTPEGARVDRIDGGVHDPSVRGRLEPACDGVCAAGEQLVGVAKQPGACRGDHGQ